MFRPNTHCTAITTFLSINWDVYNQIPDYKKSIGAMFELKNETIYSSIRPYGENDSLDEKEHSAMHSTLANSDISYPHSFVNNPIHEIPNDYESKIVGTVAASFAWDAALRFLLPDNVEGIIVEIQNSCNQSVLYELVGYDALYLGDNATKDSTYDEMVVVRDLFPTTHPNYTKTPVNCRYKIVSFVFSFIHIGRLYRQLMLTTSFSNRTFSQFREYFPAPSFTTVMKPTLRQFMLLL